MATSAKKNTNGVGDVTPTLGTGKVQADPPAGRNGTFKDAYSAPHQNGGTAPQAPKKSPAKKPSAKPASAASGPVNAGAGSIQPGGKKKKGGKKFTSIKSLRDYANKQGYGN